MSAAQLEATATERVLTLLGLWRIAAANGRPVDVKRQHALMVQAIGLMRAAQMAREDMAAAA